MAAIRRRPVRCQGGTILGDQFAVSLRAAVGAIFHATNCDRRPLDVLPAARGAAPGLRRVRLMHQLPLDLRITAGPSFANFWTADNREVWQAVCAVARGGRGPLYLWGPAGCGKSHLLAAAARLAGEDGPVFCLTQDSAASAWAALVDVPADALVCVDTLDGLIGNAAASHALFLLFEVLAPRRRLLLAAHNSPVALAISREDLRTRLASGPVMRMRALTDEGKAAALIHRARQRGLILGTDAAHYLLTHGPRDMHALCALLERLDVARAASARLTIPFLRQYLQA